MANRFSRNKKGMRPNFLRIVTSATAESAIKYRVCVSPSLRFLLALMASLLIHLCLANFFQNAPTTMFPGL